MFGIGKGMVEGMGKVMDWGIKKVIKKQVLFFFFNFFRKWVREWFDECIREWIREWFDECIRE